MFCYFQPGESKHVVLVSIGGNRVIRGGNDIVDGAVRSFDRHQIVKGALEARQFGNEEEPNARYRLSTWSMLSCLVCLYFFILVGLFDSVGLSTKMIK